ncbi:methyltransferase domain-containing protein [Streptantibioticus parmotrematis]|nr:methyltransferase domain-containing protein [Streptantibioticus parmotrematis]
MTDTDRPGEQLGRYLLDRGDMTSDWAVPFAAVPRAAFLPERMWVWDIETQATELHDRRADLAAWTRAAHRDAPIVTQWDDGRHTGPAAGKLATSSASMPSVVLSMLRDLDVVDGARVLEIGTGTGWNAGLLCARLGDANVVTVEVDAQVAATARTALGRAGWRPEVICGDGAAGHRDRAPFDRVIATAGVRRVPYAWVEQTRPGGVVLAPWGTHYSNQEALVRLTVSEDGTASGPFLRAVEFMTLRGQRLDWERFSGHVPDHYESIPAVRGTDATLGELAGLAQRFACGLRMPRCAQVVNGHRVWLFDMDSTSWTLAEFPEEGAPLVRQSGSRRLWDEVLGVLDWWEREGSPEPHHFGLTVTPDGQSAWLGDAADAWTV